VHNAGIAWCCLVKVVEAFSEVYQDNDVKEVLTSQKAEVIMENIN
jgi:3-methyladenine DNA glycosylase Tag